MFFQKPWHPGEECSDPHCKQPATHMGVYEFVKKRPMYLCDVHKLQKQRELEKFDPRLTAHSYNRGR